MGLPTPTPPDMPTTSDTPPTLATATLPPLLSTVLPPPLSTLESTPESTPDSPTLTMATATTATSSDKSSKDWEPKPIGPNVAPWRRKPIVLLTCVTCAMNQKLKDENALNCSTIVVILEYDTHCKTLGYTVGMFYFKSLR